MRVLFAVILGLALLLPMPVLAMDQTELMKKIDDMSRELDSLKKQMGEIKAAEKVAAPAEKKADKAGAPSWLEIGGDYRFRFDYLNGKVQNYMQYTGMPSTGYMPMMPGALVNLYTAGQNGYTAKNESLYTNRFGLNLKAKATEDVTVKARLLMYKVFGSSDSSPVTSPFFSPEKSGIFDGNVSHVPQDSVLRIDQAYATWSNIGGAPVWFSVGRRPSTGGVPSNLRMNVEKGGTAGVPAFLIDYAFDGMTFGVAPDIDALPGAYAKLCYGRGFDSGFKTPSNNSLKDVDMIGLNVVPYDSDVLHAELQWNRAFNMMSNPPVSAFGPVQTNVGDIDQLGLLVSGAINKLGPGNLNLFASAAISKTHPNNNGYMAPFYDMCIDANMNGTCDPGETVRTGQMAKFGLLYDDPAFGGQKESHTGNIVYFGGRYDLPATGTKIGLEYNHGSKNWIAFTPASDDMLASKMGTRGSVYEIYAIQELKQKPISKYGKAYVRLGFQYYNFEYTGSNNWLGSPKKISGLTSTPTSMNDFLGTQMYPPLKSAQNVYLTFDVEF